MKNFLTRGQAVFMAIALMIIPCLTAQQAAMAMIGNRPADPVDQPQECENAANCEPGSEPRAVLTNVRIVLRAGHGGKDTGATRVDKTTGATIYEKVITFQVVQRLHKMLSDMGATVLDARPNSEFRGLNWSSYLANDSNADFFISVHVNSMPSESSDASGIETYYFTDQSLRLAQIVQASEIKETGAVNRGVIKHPYYEVRMTNPPAILTEIGFITNDVERNKLITPDYQDKVARSIADACAQYWIEVMRKAGKRATTPASPLPPATDEGNGSQTVPPATQPTTPTTTPPLTPPSVPGGPAKPNAPQQPESSAHKVQPVNQRLLPFTLTPLPVLTPTENIDLSVPAPRHFWQRKHVKPSSMKVDLNVGGDEPLEPEQNGLSNEEVL